MFTKLMKPYPTLHWFYKLLRQQLLSNHTADRENHKCYRNSNRSPPTVTLLCIYWGCSESWSWFLDRSQSGQAELRRYFHRKTDSSVCTVGAEGTRDCSLRSGSAARGNPWYLRNFFPFQRFFHCFSWLRTHSKFSFTFSSRSPHVSWALWWEVRLNVRFRSICGECLCFKFRSKCCWRVLWWYQGTNPFFFCRYSS